MNDRHELDAGFILCIPLLLIAFFPPIAWAFWWSEMRGEDCPRLQTAIYFAATHVPAIAWGLYEFLN